MGMLLIHDVLVRRGGPMVDPAAKEAIILERGVGCVRRVGVWILVM